MAAEGGLKELMYSIEDFQFPWLKFLLPCRSETQKPFAIIKRRISSVHGLFGAQLTSLTSIQIL